MDQHVYGESGTATTVTAPAQGKITEAAHEGELEMFVSVRFKLTDALDRATKPYDIVALTRVLLLIEEQVERLLAA